MVLYFDSELMEYYDDEEIVENRYVMSQRHEGIFGLGGSG